MQPEFQNKYFMNQAMTFSVSFAKKKKKENHKKVKNVSNIS